MKSARLVLTLLALGLSGCHSNPPKTREQTEYEYDVATAQAQAEALSHGDLYNPIVSSGTYVCTVAHVPEPDKYGNVPGDQEMKTYVICSLPDEK